jgi:uncharacterized protein YjiS (DUF1127 family)
MTTTNCTEDTIRQPLALTLAAAVVAKTNALLRAIHNRREMYHLGQMTDIELADIGLRRGDLFEAVESPVHVDPTGRLGLIADARAQESLARRIH